MEQGLYAGLFMMALSVIAWGIKKYIEHLEKSRNDERSTMEAMREDTQAMLATINIAIVELRLAISSMSKECELKHLPIASDIRDLKKKSDIHESQLNKHNDRIQNLEYEHKKNNNSTVG